MDTKSIAHDIVALLKAGKHDEVSEKYHADDVVSIEAMGPPGQDLAARGKAAVEAKSEWWTANHEIKSAAVEGPFVNGDQFAVHYAMDVLIKASGQTISMREVGLYTLKDGKIVEERFFYAI